MISYKYNFMLKEDVNEFKNGDRPFANIWLIIRLRIELIKSIFGVRERVKKVIYVIPNDDFVGILMK